MITSIVEIITPVIPALPDTHPCPAFVVKRYSHTAIDAPLFNSGFETINIVENRT